MRDVAEYVIEFHFVNLVKYRPEWPGCWRNGPGQSRALSAFQLTRFEALSVLSPN